MKNSIIFIFSFLLVGLLQAQESDEEILQRAQEIENYSSLNGIWEGLYFYRDVPQAMLPDIQSTGADISGVGLRITINNGEVPIVHFKYDESSEWSIIGGEITFVQDKVGWHILISREGGLWLERQWITLARTSESTAEFTITRTVHNWFLTESLNEETQQFYSVFGVGKLEKI